MFDKYQNLVLQPQPVKFELTVNGQTISRTENTKNGVAFAKLDSFKKEGPAQFVASSGQASVRRVVQEVASDPCSIRMTAHARQERDSGRARIPFTTAPEIPCRTERS